MYCQYHRSSRSETWYSPQEPTSRLHGSKVQKLRYRSFTVDSDEIPPLRDDLTTNLRIATIFLEEEDSPSQITLRERMWMVAIPVAGEMLSRCAWGLFGVRRYLKPRQSGSDYGERRAVGNTNGRLTSCVQYRNVGGAIQHVQTKDGTCFMCLRGDPEACAWWLANVNI